MDDRFATFFELSNFPSASYLGRQCMHSVSISQQWRIQGRAGRPRPPLISKPNWDPEDREKNYFKVWMTVPPPPPLSQGWALASFILKLLEMRLLQKTLRDCNGPAARIMGNKPKRKHSLAESRTWTICTEGRLHCTTLLRIMLARKIIIFKALFPWNSAGRRYSNLVELYLSLRPRKKYARVSQGLT